jgi:hypothetical protein
MERGERGGGSVILLYAQRHDIIVCYCLVINSHGNHTENFIGLDVGIVGMVHARVGQKLVKNHILQVFLCPEVELWTLFQRVQTQYPNYSSISYYSVMVTPPTNYILTFIKPFSFV